MTEEAAAKAERVLLDASALLAVIYEEAGAEEVHEALRGRTVMSAVNVGEVVARLDEDGWTRREVAGVIDGFDLEIVPFDTATAVLSGEHRSRTRRHGIGLGGRACLATAQQLGIPVLTADRAWKKLRLPGVRVRCIGEVTRAHPGERPVVASGLGQEK